MFGSQFTCLGVIGLICLGWQAHGSEDLYQVLGVRKASTQEEIRKAYKKLARELHPDKNKEENANETFMKINAAYEILGDEKKRQDYDRHGQVSPDHGHQSPRGHGQFFRTPFGDFNFENQHTSVKNRVTERLLRTRILDDSKEKPFLFFATTDYCFQCLRAEPIWRKFTADLDILGLSHGEVDVDMDGGVARRLRVTRIPLVGAIVDGRSILFDSSELSVRNLREFLRKLFPEDLIKMLKMEEIEPFLDGWIDNKPRAILFGTYFQPELRVLAAFNKYREQIVTGYVDVTSKQTAEIVDRFNVPENKETILLFDENTEYPVHVESATKFDSSVLGGILNKHKYLALPRLARPAIYDDLCPANSKFNQQFCVILTFKSAHVQSSLVSSFRLIAREKLLPNVNFLYAFTDFQRSVMDVLRRPDQEFKVLVMARRPDYEIVYDWLDWCITSDCEEKLQSTLFKLSKRSYSFSYRSSQRYEIKDEYKGSLLTRMGRRLQEWWYYATDNYFDGDESLMLVSLLSTVVCLFILIMLVNIMSHTESPPPEIKPSQAAKNFKPSPNDKFLIYDLKHKNYEKLVKDSKSGYRLLLLMVDRERKDVFVKKFAETMMPFAKTPYFTFAFMYVDKYLIWYQKLLRLAIGEGGDHIRDLVAEHCVGTVLAINGYRKYFNIYHPKTIHLEKSQNNGDFIGMDDDSSEDELGTSPDHDLACDMPLNGDRLLREGRLLDGLTQWMDRLFDGTLPRCRVDRWPIYPVDADEYATLAGADDKKDQ